MPIRLYSCSSAILFLSESSSVAVGTVQSQLDPLDRDLVSQSASSAALLCARRYNLLPTPKSKGTLRVRSELTE